MERQVISMKHHIRNTFIWLVATLGIVRLYRKEVRKKGPLVRVLVFHDIHDREWFELMVETLCEHFYVISPDDFHARKFDQERVNILVTFDDGYASWESAVLSVLEENGIKGLFFANSALLDIAHDSAGANVFMREQLLIRPRAPLTWEGLQKLKDKGHTIGGHTCTHSNLATLHGEDLIREIRDDKHAIERMLGITLTDFAYPFGTRWHVSDEAREAVIAAGYGHVYTTISGFADPHETFSIPRLCIETGTTPKKLKRWVLGGYDLFERLKRLCVQ